MKIYSLTDYSIANFLDMNRDVDPKHVKEIGESIDKHGCHRVLNMIRTSCITGTKMLFIADGQHTFKALQERGLTINYTIVDKDSPIEIAKFIADMNTTSRGWRLENYLHVWSNIGIDTYKLVKRKYEQSGIQLSLLVQFYSLRGRHTAPDSFKDGTFDIPNLEKSIQLLSTYQACLPYVSDDYHKFLKDFATWVITNKPEKDKLVDIVKKQTIPLEEVITTLDRLYNKE